MLSLSNLKDVVTSSPRLALSTPRFSFPSSQPAASAHSAQCLSYVGAQSCSSTLMNAGKTLIAQTENALFFFFLAARCLNVAIAASACFGFDVLRLQLWLRW